MTLNIKEFSSLIKEYFNMDYIPSCNDYSELTKIIPCGENYNSKNLYMFYLISFLDFGINMFFLMLLLYL